MGPDGLSWTPTWISQRHELAWLPKPVSRAATLEAVPPGPAIRLRTRALHMQGCFDSEVVKVLRFYRAKNEELGLQLKSLQADVARLQPDVISNEELTSVQRLASIDVLHVRMQARAGAVLVWGKYRMSSGNAGR